MYKVDQVDTRYQKYKISVSCDSKNNQVLKAIQIKDFAYAVVV